MENGFALGGFAEGLTAGIDAGNRALAPGRLAAEKQAERQEKLAGEARTQILGQIKGLDTDFEKVVSERGAEAAQRLFDGLRAKSITLGGQKVSHIDLLALQAQRAGIGMVTPEILESRLSAHLASGQTTEERAGQAATVAGAQATATATATRAVNDAPAAMAADAERARLTRAPEKPQTKPGQLIFDRKLVATQFGEDSPQMQAFDEAAKQPDEVDLTNERGVRGEFTRLSGEFLDVRASFGRIAQAAENPSPAGDMALIFNYMKMLDPQSVVRESEFAQAAATGSFGERIQAGVERILTGKRLAPEMRADFVSQAEGLFKRALSQQTQLEQVYSSVAARSGLDPTRVVVDYVGDLRSFAPNALPRSMVSGGVTMESIGRMDLTELNAIDTKALSSAERKALDVRLRMLGH